MFVFFLYHIGVKNNWKVIKKKNQTKLENPHVYVCVRSLTSRLPFRTANLCFSSLLLATLWLRGGPGPWDAAPPDGATGAELVSTLGRSCFCPLSRLSTPLHLYSTFHLQTLNSRSNVLPVARCFQTLLSLWVLISVDRNSLCRNCMCAISYSLQACDCISRGGNSTLVQGGGKLVQEFCFV